MPTPNEQHTTQQDHNKVTLVPTDILHLEKEKKKINKKLGPCAQQSRSKNEFKGKMINGHVAKSIDAQALRQRLGIDSRATR
jgi:hypothetical protein